MLFGFNTNVSAGGNVFHVQTEDRGTTTALIDTTVYCRGRVMHRRTNNYFDLLTSGASHEAELKGRIEQQHRGVLEEIRSGKLHLIVPEAPASVPAAAIANNPPPAALIVELINSRNWLTGKHVLLQIAVRQPDDLTPVAGARVAARIDGAASPAEHTAVTTSHGQAQIEFEMPTLSGAGVVLMIEARQGLANGHLRFHLRAKPRVPAD